MTQFDSIVKKSSCSGSAAGKSSPAVTFAPVNDVDTSQPTILAIEGGARLHGPCIASKISKTFCGQIVVSAPVETSLQLSGV